MHIMQILIDPTLVARLTAIKLAYESGAITSIPYIEPKNDHDFSQFDHILDIKKQEDSSGSGGGGGGGSIRGLRKSTRAPNKRR
jgi:uncharacterized membrane protein